AAWRARDRLKTRSTSAKTPPASSLITLRGGSEAVAENDFENELVRARRQTHADARVEFPARPEVEIENREDLVLLLLDGIEPGQRTNRTVILEPDRDPVRDRVADLRIR